MSRFIKVVLGSAAIATSGVVAYAYPQIYRGEYLEQSPFDTSKLSIKARLANFVVGSDDDIAQSKTLKLINPNKNEVLYDYFEKQVDAETTRKILEKYKTREEILAQLQKGIFNGPTLLFHRIVTSPYLKKQVDNNRIAGFTKVEPELKKLNVDQLPKAKIVGIPLLPTSDKINYIWDADQVAATKGLFPLHTVIYGIFDFANYGKRSNGGFFEFTFGSDLIDTTAIHRVEYFTVKDAENKDRLVVRFTNASVLVPPNSPKFTDETKGLHEFMTRSLVWDGIRSLTSDL